MASSIAVHDNNEINDAQQQEHQQMIQLLNPLTGSREYVPATTPHRKKKLQQLATQFNVEVEQIENPPFEILDNTDDLEPQPAHIVIQSTQQQQQVQSKTNMSSINQIQSQHIQSHPKGIATATQYSNVQIAPKTNNQPIIQVQNQQQNILTQSSFAKNVYNNQPNQFLPQINRNQSKQMENGGSGYISDYYKNKNMKRPPDLRSEKKSYDGSNKYVSDQNSEDPNFQHGQVQVSGSGNISNTNGYNKISGKKFFKSKIDFMAPIKSLQKREIDPLANNLSDDTYYEPPIGLPNGETYKPQLPDPYANNNQRKGGPPTIKGSDNGSSQHQRSASLSKRSVGQYDISNEFHNQVVQKYANLTQIQEEPKNKFTYRKELNPPNINSTRAMASQLVPIVQKNQIIQRRQSNNIQQQQYSSSRGMGSGKKYGNASLDNGRTGNMSPVRLPSLRNPNSKGQTEYSNLQSHVQNLTGQSNRTNGLCPVCSMKHNSNHPHMIQKVIPVRQKILPSKGPLYLNRSFTKGLNGSNSSQRSLNISSRNKQGSRSGSLSVSSSARRIKGETNYNNIDRLRSVNKIRTIDTSSRIPSKQQSEFNRNFKSLSPRVTNMPKVTSRSNLQRNVSNNMSTPKRSQQSGKTLFASNNKPATQTQQKEEEPELVCREKELDPSIEEEIKDGFFELRQKFKDQGESSIYVSHVVLHAKHPIFGKLDIDTLKGLLTDSSIIYLSKDQVLYRNGSQDNFVYFILFGKLALLLQGGLNNNEQQQDVTSVGTQITLGKVNIGWTVGEEVLYDKNLQIRQETCAALVESCLLGILKSKLAIIQKNLLDKGNQKDYFVIESVLKGNYLIKTQWRKDMQEYYGQSVKSRSTPGQSVKDMGEGGENNGLFLS